MEDCARALMARQDFSFRDECTHREDQLMRTRFSFFPFLSFHFLSCINAGSVFACIMPSSDGLGHYPVFIQVI